MMSILSYLIDKRVLNFIIIIGLSFITLIWTFFIYHMKINIDVIMIITFSRIIASAIILQDYSLSWSKASAKTFLIKSIVNITAFMIYLPFLYGVVRFSFLVSELFFYIFAINFMMYSYYYYMNKSHIKKTKNVVIYGAGRAGIKLKSEFLNSNYNIKYFIDDNTKLQNRSIDSIKIISQDIFKKKIDNNRLDLLVIGMPSIPKTRIKEIYNELKRYFVKIQILPSIDNILQNQEFFTQLKDISVEDLLARHPKDLDTKRIKNFIKDKVILVTGAGGSIGSEICRQCSLFDAKHLILLDHSEYNLYKITEKLKDFNISSVMQDITNIKLLNKTFNKYRPDLVIHAAAYKHVSLVEENIEEAILNNIIGTKNVIDLSIQYGVKKFVLISTDKAVRPTSIMGATKRVTELYANNIDSKNTEISAVRFGNVLGSSGSVVPKFKQQIKQGGPITVTHPDVTRYFMLIQEACQLVLQTASMANGGELFILDMGKPVKIADLAKEMISLCNKNGLIDIKFIGLKKGEKLYEELLISKNEKKTEYSSIFITNPTKYDIDLLNLDIKSLLNSSDKIKALQKIVPEFKK